MRRYITRENVSLLLRRSIVGTTTKVAAVKVLWGVFCWQKPNLGSDAATTRVRRLRLRNFKNVHVNILETTRRDLGGRPRRSVNQCKAVSI